MTTVIILLDAFRHDYLQPDTTPFLAALSKKGTFFREVRPSPGFCERTEIIAGLKTTESGYLTAIGYNPAESPYRNVRGLRLLDLLEEVVPKSLALPGRKTPGGVRRMFRKLANQIIGAHSKQLKPYCIPYRKLRSFSLTEDSFEHDIPNAFGVESIFDIVRKAGKSFSIEAFTSLAKPDRFLGDRERLEYVLGDVRKRDCALYLIYQGTPDALGHKHGPESLEFRARLRHFDDMLESFVTSFKAVRPKSTFVLLGDHGMHSVNRVLDVNTKLKCIEKKLRISEYQDYIYFLDSTIVRFWFLNKAVEDKLMSELSNDEEVTTFGIFIDENNAKEVGIPFPDRRYGDRIWWANPGVVVYPDYFNSSGPPRGMHGYCIPSKANHGMCIVFGESVPCATVPEVELVKLCGVVKQLVGKETVLETVFNCY